MSIDIILIAVFALVILLAFIMAEMPIWIALAGSGAIGLLLLSGPNITYSTLGSIPYNATGKYALIIIPMFVFMGIMANKAGIAEDIFTVAARMVRKLPGGLGVATIVACGGFSAVTGSQVATVATIGRLAIGQMTKHGYRPNAAAALVALGGTLGVLIPPSILMVIIAIMTSQSVGALLLAGFVPGIISMFAYMITVVIFYKRGFFEPKTEKEIAAVASFKAAMESTATGNIATKTNTGSLKLLTRKQAYEPGYTPLELKNYVGTGYTILLFLIVIGGMYSGIFTATEAGAMAATAAVIILIIRRAGSGFKNLAVAIKDGLIEAASVSSMIFAMLFGGAIFAFFLLKTGVPSNLAKSLIAMDLPPILIIIAALIMLIILGALMDELSILLIVIPLIWPVVDAMGVNGIWFGILVAKATSLGLIAPPVGINVFVAAGLSKDVSADGIYKAILPFFLTEIAVIALLILVPEISTFVPDLLGGKIG